MRRALLLAAALLLAGPAPAQHRPQRADSLAHVARIRRLDSLFRAPWRTDSLYRRPRK